MSKLLDAFSTNVKFQIAIPEALYDSYRQQAEANDRTVEDEIALRLQRCREHTATKPLYFTDDERADLERAIGRSARTPGHVVNGLRNLVSISVGGVEVEIPTVVQQRIRSRVFRGETYQQVVEREVIRGLRVFCGME